MIELCFSMSYMNSSVHMFRQHFCSLNKNYDKTIVEGNMDASKNIYEMNEFNQKNCSNHLLSLQSGA